MNPVAKILGCTKHSTKQLQWCLLAICFSQIQDQFHFISIHTNAIGMPLNDLIQERISFKRQRIFVCLGMDYVNNKQGPLFSTAVRYISTASFILAYLLERKPTLHSYKGNQVFKKLIEYQCSYRSKYSRAPISSRQVKFSIFISILLEGSFQLCNDKGRKEHILITSRTTALTFSWVVFFFN